MWISYYKIGALDKVIFEHAGAFPPKKPIAIQNANAFKSLTQYLNLSQYPNVKFCLIYKKNKQLNLKYWYIKSCNILDANIFINKTKKLYFCKRYKVNYWSI